MRTSCTLAHILVAALLHAQTEWHVQVLANMPVAVANNAVCAAEVDGEWYVYSFGGIGSDLDMSSIHRHCYRYDVDTDQWSALPDLPDTLGKIASAVSVVQGVAYVIGGYHVFNGAPFELSSDRVHRMDLTSNAWLSDGAPLPVPIDDQVQGVWRDSLIYVVGGWSNTTNVTAVQIYDPALDTWTAGTALPNTNFFKSFGASGVIVGDTIYYHGGASNGFNFPARSEVRKGVIDPNDPAQITWSLVSSCPSPSYRTAAFTLWGRPRWVGGSEVSYNYDALAYNGGTVVQPSMLLRTLDPLTDQCASTTVALPVMDQRGIGELDNERYVLAGGISAGAQASSGTFLISPGPAGIVHEHEEEISLYPVPCSDELSLSAGFVHPLHFRVADLSGRIQLEGSLPSGMRTISVSELVPGGYVLQLFTGQHVHYLRFWSLE
ncbi:MAG: hypothetical protein KDB88_12800 [Flavobacteriales bacterium]|nr:hypothetical protein [Flavobacteriales bacterium]